METDTIEKIYKDIFLNTQCSTIDLFLCGGASNKTNISNRDQLRKQLENDKNLAIFYPEDMFKELLNRKKYDLFTLENFLAENSDLIMIVCESPGSFAELGAFTENNKLASKLLVLIQKKYKNDKSFIVQGPIRYIEKQDKKKVIYFNNDMKSMEKAVKKYLKEKYWFYGKKRLAKKYENHTKKINLISGQFYFILILLYFYKSIEIKEMNDTIRNIYKKENFESNRFEIIYTAALKRLYKEGLLMKIIEKNSYYYQLTSKGFVMVKELLKNVRLENRDKLINRIRLEIIAVQYH
jgi:hypothetical protein